MKEMTFQQFCDNITLDMEVSPTTDSTMITNPKILSITSNIINDLSAKKNRLGNMKVTYVTAYLENFTEDELSAELHKKTVDDEIPDELINRLSSGIYGVKYDELSAQQKNIIKVLAIYIILQI